MDTEQEPKYCKLLSSQVAVIKVPKFGETMNNGLNQTKANADFERALVPAPSHEQIDDDLLHTKPSENEFRNCGSDEEIMVKIARSESGACSQRKLLNFTQNALKRRPKLN